MTSTSRETSQEYTWEIILFNSSIHEKLAKNEHKSSNACVSQLQTSVHPKFSPNHHAKKTISLGALCMVARFIGLLKNTNKRRRYAKVKRDVEEMLFYHRATSSGEKINFESPEEVKRRKLLKTNNKIRESIRLWWDSIVPKKTAETIQKTEYVKLLFLIYEALLVPKGDWKNLSEIDWRSDSKGKGSMDFELFFDAVFDLVDIWCETTKVAEYVYFLNSLLKQMSILAAEKYSHLPSENIVKSITEVENMKSARVVEKIEESMKDKILEILWSKQMTIHRDMNRLEHENGKLFQICITKLRKDKENLPFDAKQGRDIRRGIRVYGRDVKKIRKNFKSLYSRTLRSIMNKMEEIERKNMEKIWKNTVESKTRKLNKRLKAKKGKRRKLKPILKCVAKVRAKTTNIVMDKTLWDNSNNNQAPPNFINNDDFCYHDSISDETFVDSPTKNGGFLSPLWKRPKPRNLVSPCKIFPKYKPAKEIVKENNCANFQYDTDKVKTSVCGLELLGGQVGDSLRQESKKLKPLNRKMKVGPSKPFPFLLAKRLKVEVKLDFARKKLHPIKNRHEEKPFNKLLSIERARIRGDSRRKVSIMKRNYRVLLNFFNPKKHKKDRYNRFLKYDNTIIQDRSLRGTNLAERGRIQYFEWNY